MTDTGRHPTDEGFHEIQLGGKQIVFLFMAATIVAVVIFLLGVFVGRGVQAERTGRAAQAPPSTAPAASTSGAPAAPATAGTEALTYPQRLQSDAPVPEQLKSVPAPPPVASEEPAPPPPPGGEDGWVIQVAALRDREAAMAIVKRLSDKGYPAFLLDPAPGAPAPVHRVRVGRYADRAEAERIARRLEREEQFKPIVAR